MSASGGNIKFIEYIECCNVLAPGGCEGCETQQKEGCNMQHLQQCKYAVDWYQEMS